MPLPKWELASGRRAMCTMCGSINSAHVFPAALTAPEAVRTEAAMEGEAACFDHPAKRAVAACQQCGRFLCPLCTIEFENATWCPSCVAAGAGRARSANLEASRTLYDTMAFMTPLLALLVWPLTTIAGPAAVVFSIMKWRAPLSLVRRSRWRFVAAIVLGLAEVVGWIWGIAYLIGRSRMVKL